MNYKNLSLITLFIIISLLFSSFLIFKLDSFKQENYIVIISLSIFIFILLYFSTKYYFNYSEYFDSKKENNEIEKYCAKMDNARPCPDGTIQCDSLVGYCYDKLNDRMISTFFNDKLDYCPETEEGKKSNKPFSYNQKRVWFKKNGKDEKKCSNLIGVKSKYSENEKKRIENEICPSKDNAKKCPEFTLECENQSGYCYEPNRDMMVSTYFNKDEDYCPESGGGKKGNYPFKIMDQLFWFRKKGIDEKCPNIIQKNKENNDKNNKIKAFSCPNKNMIPDCPVGTEECINMKGYCYDKYKDIMISSYFDESKDYCPNTQEGNVNNHPIVIDGYSHWFRGHGLDNSCILKS